MSHILSTLTGGLLRQVILLFLLLGYCGSKPISRIGVAEIGHTEDGRDFAHVAISDWSTLIGNGALLYADADYAQNTGGVGAWIGVLKNEKAGTEGIHVSSNVLTAGIDAHGGLMGRATAFDGTLHAGPVHINAGICFDTGLVFQNDSAEIKVLGVGMKAGRDGFEACMWFCLGVSWG